MRQNQVFVWDGAMLFALWDISNARHRHYAACLMLAPEEPFSIMLDGSPARECRACLLDANTWHTLNSRGARFVNILLEPQHPWFLQMKSLLLANPFVELDSLSFKRLKPDWEGLFAAKWSCDEALQWSRRMVGAVIDTQLKAHPLDPRLSEVLRILRGAGHSRITPAAISKKIGLSPFTLMRMFKATLGVRISEYVLWRRLIKGLGMVDGKRTLTEIAHEVGFYDQAHLTRTAQRMAGLQPSFFNSSAPLRVCNCSSAGSAQ